MSGAVSKYDSDCERDCIELVDSEVRQDELIAYIKRLETMLERVSDCTEGTLAWDIDEVLATRPEGLDG